MSGEVTRRSEILDIVRRITTIESHIRVHARELYETIEILEATLTPAEMRDIQLRLNAIECDWSHVREAIFSRFNG